MITWKIENMLDKLDDLSKEVSRQNTEGLLAAYKTRDKKCR